MVGNPKMGQQVAKLVRRYVTALRASSFKAINNTIIVMSHGFRIQSEYGIILQMGSFISAWFI